MGYTLHLLILFLSESWMAAFAELRPLSKELPLWFGFQMAALKSQLFHCTNTLLEEELIHEQRWKRRRLLCSCLIALALSAGSLLSFSACQKSASARLIYSATDFYRCSSLTRPKLLFLLKIHFIQGPFKTDTSLLWCILEVLNVSLSIQICFLIKIWLSLTDLISIVSWPGGNLRSWWATASSLCSASAWCCTPTSSPWRPTTCSSRSGLAFQQPPPGTNL